MPLAAPSMAPGFDLRLCPIYGLLRHAHAGTLDLVYQRGVGVKVLRPERVWLDPVVHLGGQTHQSQPFLE